MGSKKQRKGKKSSIKSSPEKLTPNQKTKLSPNEILKMQVGLLNNFASNAGKKTCVSKK